MATSFMSTIISPLVLLIVLLPAITSHAPPRCFSSIISFGDSLADTGNIVHLIGDQGNNTVIVGKLPYGMTYFHRYAGRASDGRLIIDFVAKALKLPFVPPYLDGPDGHGFRKGVNFAVSGAPAQDVSFFTKRGLPLPVNKSLDDEVKWFKQLLPSLCSSEKQCKQFIGNSLIFVGSIGGNDFNAAFGGRLDQNQTRTFIPSIIKKIRKTIKMLVKLGAETMIVPGIPPLGCTSLYLTSFGQVPKDEVGCLKNVNNILVEYHHQLVIELHHLRKKYPHVNIIFADFYTAVYNIIKSPGQFGFEKVFGACCGTGGPLNVNIQALCGSPGTTVCKDPSKYIDWDGIHYTEAVYRIVADGFLKGPFAFPPILHACSKH